MSWAYLVSVLDAFQDKHFATILIMILWIRVLRRKKNIFFGLVWLVSNCSFHCVVAENIYTHITKGILSESPALLVRGSKSQEIPEGKGLDSQFIFQLSFTSSLLGRSLMLFDCVLTVVTRQNISYKRDPKRMVHFCFEGKELPTGIMCCQCMWKTQLRTMTLSGMTPLPLVFITWRMQREHFQTY